MPSFALAAAGTGLVSALLHAAMLSGSVAAILLAYLAQLPLFLIGLWVGVAGVAVATTVAVVALAAAGGMLFALVYLIVNAAPAVVVTYLAQLNRPREDGTREFLPPGIIVTWIIGFASVVFLIAVVLMSGAPDGAEGTLRNFVATGLRQFPMNVDNATLATTAATIAHVLPGAAGVSWALMVIVNAMLAQAVLARAGRNFRPTPSMASLELPAWTLGLTAIVAIGGVMPGLAGFVGANLALLFLFAYALAGLAVLHVFAARTAYRGVLLAGLYVFIFIFGWPIVLVALLGLAEPWLNLRRRGGGNTNT